MLRGFDFGKGLMNQVVAFQRATPQQQQRKSAGLKKALQKYTKRYMEIIEKPGGANPGLLKNGAETVVEASLALQDGSIAYPVYADLVSRSRKVPVVPGLDKLVDRLLALETSLKDERVSLLSYRITTGKLKPDRLLGYLSERAKLTGETPHWKDYVWGVNKLLKENSLNLSSKLITDALAELLANKQKLGDRATDVRVLVVQSLIQNKQVDKAEELLIETQADTDQLPQSYLDVVEELLDVYPTAEWGLHVMALKPLLSKYVDGDTGWGMVEAKLLRASRHREGLVELFLGLEFLPSSERLSLYSLEQIRLLPDKSRREQMIQRWKKLYADEGIPIPTKAAEILGGKPDAQEPADASEQNEEKPQLADDALDTTESAELPEVEEQVEASGAEALALADCPDDTEVRLRLAESFATGVTAAEADELLAAMPTSEDHDWQLQAMRLWFAERFVEQNDIATATEYLSAIPVDTPDTAQALAQILRRVDDIQQLPIEAIDLLVRLDLETGDWQQALDVLNTASLEQEERFELATSIDTWIVAQNEAPPQMIMGLAHVRRLQHDDAEAGFEPATTASLLAPADEAVQADYQTWLDVLPAETTHYQRAQQATYLSAVEGHTDLLPVALAEIEALAGVRGDNLPPEPRDWLNSLRPLLSDVPATDQDELQRQWARLSLMYATKAGPAEEIPEVFQAATEQVAAKVALTLADELGVPLPASSRLLVECEALARDGEWRQALELFRDLEPEDSTSLLPVSLLCDYLPETNLLEAVEQLQVVLSESDNQRGQLELVRSIDTRLAADSGLATGPELRDFADNLLLKLSQLPFEPATRYLLDSNRQIGDPVEQVRHLLILAREGDTEVLDNLESALLQLLPPGKPADVIEQAATVLARAYHSEQPDRALENLCRAGQALPQPRWTLALIDELELQPASAAGAVQLGQLAVKLGDHERALEQVNQLEQQDAKAEARDLADAVAAISPDSDVALRTTIRVLLSSDPPDFNAATKHLLLLAQFYQERDANLKEEMEVLREEIEQALSADHGLPEAQHLRLGLAALSSDTEQVTVIIDQVVEQGPEAIDKLLSLFEGLALEDAEIPTALVVTWGRVLFKAGRTADALDRLAGLRESVGDYPEYTSLLKEIRDEGGGPGASMQLGETFLRVNLWQRSAEEYVTALEQDGSLAVPVLNQLRHHGALEPNPMQYPLHLLALRCVAESDRTSDWGWALSALTWLLPRWSPEELHGLASMLWDNIDRVELTPGQRIELLVHLYRLACKLGQAEQAVSHLVTAWQLADEPGPELIEILQDLDRSKLPKDSLSWPTIRQLDLEAAVLAGSPDQVIEAAQALAKIGLAERNKAIAALTDYQHQAEDPAPVLIARLRLLDLGSAIERQQFIDELLAAAETELPAGQVHSLIRTVLELADETTESLELTKLLLQLFRQLGDEARAWQLALCFIQGDDELSSLAMEVLVQLADNEFAVIQRVVLLEVYLLRGETARTVELLADLEPDDLGDHGAAAAAIVETMLATPQEAAARGWLVQYYRTAGELALAADHLVWSHATSNPLPDEWLHEQDTGELLFRSGQLMELQGDSKAASINFYKVLDDSKAGAFTRAAAALRLSSLVEQEGQLQEAERLVQVALGSLPGHAPAEERLVVLARAIKVQRIDELRREPDSSQRTIEVAGLLRAIGETVEAINELQAGLSRGQTDMGIYLELGVCFSASGDYAIARRVFDKIIQDTQDGSGVEQRLEALYGLAAANEQLGDIDAAIHNLEQILMLRHNFRDSRERLNALSQRVRSEASQDLTKHVAKKERARTEIISEILSLLGTPSEHSEDNEQ